MLDTVTSYHCQQYQGKRVTQTQGNSEKSHFGSDLGPMGCKFFFQNPASQSLDIMVSYYQVKYRKKLMIQF